MSKVDSVLIGKILKDNDEGLSTHKIADKYGLPQSKVYRLLKSLSTDGDEEGPAEKEKTTPVTTTKDEVMKKLTSSKKAVPTHIEDPIEAYWSKYRPHYDNSIYINQDDLRKTKNWTIDEGITFWKENYDKRVPLFINGVFSGVKLWLRSDCNV